MKIFGFNITRSAPAPVTRSFDPAAWLTGRDLPTGPCLSNAYEQVVWVYRAINVIAEQIANIPFLFSRGERGRENLITSGPLLDFYAQPHPHINQFQYWEEIITSTDHAKYDVMQGARLNFIENRIA